MLVGNVEQNVRNRSWTLARGLMLAGAALLWLPMVQAQDTTETALTGSTCAADRAGGALNCTANEYVVTATSQSNTITACHIGDQILIDVLVGIQSSSADRYDIGYFVGEGGNNPAVAGGLCSVATFPQAPTGTNVSGGQWFKAGANACGDYNKNSNSTNLVQGVKVTCAADANGNLAFPFVVSYANNSAGACTGNTDVKPGGPAKCVANVVPVTNVVVTFNADPGCGKTVTYDPVAGTVTSVITISNAGPDSADNTAFDDNVPAPVSVTGAVCGNALGSAACPAGALTILGNDVSGTIPTLPSGGSVQITITGTVPSGLTDLYSNTATITPLAGVVIDPNTQNNTCTNSAQLPVKLQQFEVK